MVYIKNFSSIKTNDDEQLKNNVSQHRHPIELVTETGQAVQMSIHQRSPFIAQNLERVFPDWVLPVTTCRVVVVLQQSRYLLADTAPHVEREKDRLREKFIGFGSDVTRNLRDHGYLSDLIDPRTGYPQFSRPGEIPHDDTAVVRALLGFPVIHNNCSVLEHPIWGSAIYPGILMSSAPPQVIKHTLKRVVVQHGWREPKTDLQLSIGV